MNIEVKVEKIIKLILTNQEAIWLRNYLQNGIPDESKEDKIMRESFWILLNDEI